MTLNFECDGRGHTFLGRQFASYPFHVCKVHRADRNWPEMATIYTQSCAGGLFEHDRHRIEITAAEGAAAHVTTQASTIVHSMKQGQARQSCVIHAAARSHVEMIADPQILFPGSSFLGAVRITVEPGAAVVFSDSILTHDPQNKGDCPRAYRNEIIVQTPGERALAIDRIDLDEIHFRNPVPGVMGAFRAYGTLLLIAPGMALADGAHERPVAGEGALVGASRLPHDAGRLFRILAADGTALKRALTACWTWSRVALTNHSPGPRRK